MALTAAERQRRYRAKNRHKTHDNCLECGKCHAQYDKGCGRGRPKNYKLTELSK